jgi:uncharacterized damage-inducible protein DinB
MQASSGAGRFKEKASGVHRRTNSPICGEHGRREQGECGERARARNLLAQHEAERLMENCENTKHNIPRQNEGADMSAGFVETYRAFAHNNAWANCRLLAACANLSQADFEAQRTSFFPSLQLTLNHNYVVDLFYVDALEGGWLGPKAWENEVPCPSIAELTRAQAAADKRLIAVCDALTPELLAGIVRVNRDTQVQTERRDRLLMHLFQHQIHHRGQAHAMLAGTAVKPPQLDEFFSIAEAPLRAAEFASLGWTEERVWGP